MSGALAGLVYPPASGGGGGGGTLTVTIGAGTSAGSVNGNHTFPMNTFAASGGTGPYVGTWSNTNDGYGSWNSGTGATFTPIVTHMGPGDRSTATYVCSVVDSLGATGKSNNAVYTFTDTSNA